MNFNVGDRVKVVVDYSDDDPTDFNAEGKVIKIYDDKWLYPVVVVLDNAELNSVFGIINGGVPCNLYKEEELELLA